MQIKHVALWAIAALSTSVAAKEIELTFYENQCQGDVRGRLSTDYDASDCLDYPRNNAHFVKVHSECSHNHCLTIKFYKGGNCGREDGAMDVSDGCHNINVGFYPGAYKARCVPCGK